MSFSFNPIDIWNHIQQSNTPIVGEGDAPPRPAGPGDPFYVNPDAAGSDPHTGLRRGDPARGEDPTKLYDQTPDGYSFPVADVDPSAGSQPGPQVTEVGGGSWRRDADTPQRTVGQAVGDAIGDIPGVVGTTARGAAGAAGTVVNEATGGALGGSSGPDVPLVSLEPQRNQATQAYGRALGIADQAAAYEGASIRDVVPIVADRISAQQITAPTIGDAAQAQAAQAGQTTINTAQADAARARMLGALGTVDQEAAGTGLGAQLVRARMASALERINQQAQGAANQARGAERAGARREAYMQAGQLGLQAALGAEEQALQARLGAQATALQGAGQLRAGDESRALSQANIDAEAARLNAQLATAVSQGNAGEINRIKKEQADLSLRASQSNQGASLQADQSNQGAGLTAQINTQKLGVDRDVQAASSKRDDQRTRIDGQIGATNAATGATNAGTGAAQAENTGITAREQAKAIEKGGLIGAIATTGAALAPVLSDKRAKRNIETEDSDDTADFLQALRAVAYNYKADPPNQPARHGVLAQDLEKSKIGKSVVYTTADGTKMVDPVALTMALAAAVADQLPKKGKR